MFQRYSRGLKERLGSFLGVPLQGCSKGIQRVKNMPGVIQGVQGGFRNNPGVFKGFQVHSMDVPEVFQRASGAFKEF